MDRKAHRVREQAILDAYSLGQITRDEAGKRLTEAYLDYYQAQSALRLTDECDGRAR
jgi:hypothetical protein